MKIKIEEAVKILEDNESFFLVTHQSPDGDTLGSAFGLKYALKKMGKQAKVVCSDELPRKFKYLGELNTVEEFSPNDILIGIDLADLNLLGANLQQFAKKFDLCIDHHPSNTMYAQKNLINSEEAATAQIIYDIICRLKIEIDQQISSCIYTGISTDTGCFKFSNTSAKTHFIAAKMIESGCDYHKINKKMFYTKTKSQIELEKEVLKTLSFHFDGLCCIITISNELIQKFCSDDDDLNSFSSIPIQIQDVKIGITLKQKTETQVKVSVRTDGQINASKICNMIGGGGHKAAAGGIITGSLENAKTLIIECVKKNLEKNKGC